LAEIFTKNEYFHYREISDGSHDSPLYLADEAFDG
jgi:hypothetical protein